jgi:phosphate transport system substrate-binding protein
MAQKNETIPLLLALLITFAIVGAGIRWFLNQSPQLKPVAETPPTEPVTPPPVTPAPIPANPSTSSGGIFPLVAQVPMGTTIRLNGSTSMVQLNEAFKTGFMQQYPGTIVIANASGTEVGLRDLLDLKIDLAAVSRPLTPGEQQQGLVSVPVATDAIAVFVGKDNPFQGNLTQAQVRGIFQGTIQNWSEVGGPNIPIKVINRAPTSGTREFFQEVVLQGQSFGNSPNITTLNVDETTPIIRSIGTEAISYATYSQIANQSKVRFIPIDGLSPTDFSYPLQRILYYVYREPASPSVEAFLGFVQSSQGENALKSN